MDAPVEDLAEHQMSGETVNLHNQKQGHDDLGAGGGEKRWPGWPGDSVFRILVPSHKVGGIIGRKGEFIKRMCEESRARIKILDGPPSATERAVIISAKEEQDALISPAMDGLLRVHTRIVDGLDGELKQAPSIGGSMVPTRLLVAASQAGTLIGKHGTTIKSIQEASNSTVRILDDLPPVALQDDRVVEIQGEPTAVHRAVELIANHLRRFLVDRSVLPLFEMHMSMPRPHMEQNMQYMPPQNMPPPQSWGHPQGLPPNAGGPDYGGNPHFMPPRDNFYPPPEYSHYEKPPHHGISTYGRDATPMGVHLSNNQQPQPMVSQVTHQMQVPLLYADAVIGAAGSNISYIRRSSGAAITIQESRGAPGEMTVEINGTATQVQTAQQLIQNFMAGAGAPAPLPAPVQNHPMGPADQGYGQPMGPADQGYGSYQMGPADQGYGSYPAAHGPVYGSPPANAGPAAHAGGGYSSGYGTNYGY